MIKSWVFAAAAMAMLAQLARGVFRSAVGREMRRTKAGGIDLLSKVAVFG
ncbi:hypothetical protein [Microvirga sp. 2TAF3]